MESGDSNVINVILMPVLGVGVATHYKVWHRSESEKQHPTDKYQVEWSIDSCF